MKRLLPLFIIAAAAWACDDERLDGEYEEQCQSYCTVGSAFPCACSPEGGCADGSVCGMLEPGDSMGICLAPCTSDSDCTTYLPCAAVPLCMMINNETGERHCGYSCKATEECPKNMFCRGGEVDGVCSPRL